MDSNATATSRNSGSDSLSGVHVVIGSDVRYQGDSLPKGWDPTGTVIGLKGLDPNSRTADIQFKSGTEHVRQGIPVSQLILLASGNHSVQDDCK